MKAPKVKAKPLESSTQVMGKNEILLKKEHKAIYDYFVKVLEGKAKLKENKGITDHFISAYNNIPLDNVNLKDINSLSEENFCQFLLSVFKEVREKKLANKENLENDERKKLVDDCVADIRVTEAKDSLIKLIGLPLGIKIDPKNISSSFMNGVKEKIPFLSKDKKEEDEPPLSDEEMVTAFVRKVFIPVLFSVASILIFGPTTLAVFAAVIGTIFAVKGGVEVLFSNNKKGTLYDPSSQDKDDTEKRARLNEKIRNGIDDILKTPIERPLETIADGSKKQPTPEQASQVGNKGGEQLTVLDEQVTVDQLVEEQGQAVK
ncbi:hypothetical protein wVul_0958 [Wolbachia endosymbiont of Armadillidium vulgare str. wVulC]|uniref:hypothetical protein n=1 Tax=Wolbachia endosymbiont of Armadillidium vulgare TaxID=77039 RepID=UPI00064AF11D|nr:hypothetical protein [Wolbachia endosymbiont of Armadillidium vulgare]KLT22593.1 hypothetical protein wVul_0958 [Wolbachia endosymbiont of Armadillidium vulgare str. wVulC]OJH31735.1 hypothetical protein Wxf_01136 [Wolbachia endosymbiont of Armadillidium vulgare]OJH32747.1 hypothetical protein Wxf_02201 [Wolbachia endosymbiont of Armadillidium vulgare]OJH33369.1 hypothetical protein Wxf_02855 [Wolbachia endosymbiont of Armadillidium vulgare]